MNVCNLVPQSERGLALVKRALHGEVVESLEMKRVTKDGRTLNVWLTMTIVADDQGKPEYLATTERDISKLPTARK